MAMKKRYIFLPIILLILAIFIFIIMSMARTPPSQETTERLPVLVEYHLVEPAEVQFTVPGQGNVMPRFATQITAEVTGRIAWVSPKFVAGGFFDKDEPLLRIDDFDYETAHEEAKANLARAQATLAEERARGQVAEAEWRSIEAGEIPDLGLRRPQIASELANLQSAQARLAQAERNLERTEIKAPFAGVLQARNVNLGQYISVNTNVGMLYGTDLAEVRIPLSDFDLALVDVPTGRDPGFVGPAVRLQADIGGRPQEWMGTLVRTEGVVDPERRVTFAVVEVKDPYNRIAQQHPEALTFGRFVRAEVQGVKVPDLIELPRYAVNSNQQVWLITADNTLEQRIVEVYRRNRNSAYISSGLQQGDKVMLTQLENPLNGMRVRTPDDIERPRGEENTGEE